MSVEDKGNLEKCIKIGRLSTILRMLTGLENTFHWFFDLCDSYFKDTFSETTFGN